MLANSVVIMLSDMSGYVYSWERDTILFAACSLAGAIGIRMAAEQANKWPEDTYLRRTEVTTKRFLLCPPFSGGTKTMYSMY